MEVIGLEGGKEALDLGVIVRVSRETHARFQTVSAQQAAVFGAGILAAAIIWWISPARRTALAERPAQCGQREGRCADTGEDPAEHLTAVEIELDGQKLAFAGFDVGHRPRSTLGPVGPVARSVGPGDWGRWVHRAGSGWYAAKSVGLAGPNAPLHQLHAF